MPGIIGIISKTSIDKNKQDISEMVNCMLHESFYVSGTYCNDQMGVYTGWICHKDSFCDCMPVWNEKKDIALIYFGENFTDLELFDQLKAKHHRFDRTNASYIIHMYEEKGIDFLQDLNGWFSGIIIDLQENKVILFNDRYGMQKVFYYETKDAFYCASEAKALLKVCPELRELDMRGLGELLSFDCALENRTLFKNVSLLPTASAWIFTNDTHPVKTNYFDPSVWENQPWLEKNFFYDRLRETFRRILPRYFRSNLPIAISLTGGLDTRVIMANMDLPAGKYPCYTFGGMYRDCYDVKIARKVAEACHQTHQTIPVDKNFLQDFPQYADKTIYITDGYLGLEGASEVYINNMARNIAPIRLTGNFGGEVLRGISHLTARPQNANLFSPDFHKYLQAVKTTLDEQERDSPLSFILFNDTPWSENNRLVSEQSQLTLRTPYMDNDLVELLYRAPPEVTENRNVSLRLISDGNRSLASILTDRGIGNNLKFPFSNLAHLYYEFLFKAEYAYDYGMPQWLAKLDSTFKYMHFEKLFLGHHKFNHFRLWYRDELADYVKMILLDEKTLSRPYLNRKAVEEIVEGHTEGYHNYTTDIHKMLTVELIQRLLIEQ
jgi:asparagine synthase (glutamine-hydrolysing)